MQKFILASDHAGFELKEEVKQYLKAKNFEIIDLGTDSEESVSYSEYGKKLGKYIHENPNNTYGIGICGTGLGMSYAVNRYTGVRGARIMSIEDAHLAKQHNNANVLVFAGRQSTFDDVKKMIDEFLKTKFEGGRHEIRIEELDKDL